MALTLPVQDPVLIMAIATAAFLLMPLLTERLRMPDIIGVVLAGVIVGPHGLGLLERDETIELLGSVGILYLVFLAGLEVDLGDLSRKRKRAISFGVLTFLVPQVIGTLGALFIFNYSFATSILLGSVFSSHSFLALLIAKRMNLTERELVISVIGGTVITDTLALFVLAVVSKSTTGDFGILFVLQLLAQTIIYAGVVLFGLPVLGRWFFKRVTDGTKHFTFMMTLLLACGYVAHIAGLEPIIGAFLAGLGMNRLVPHSSALANRAFFFGNSFFVPFFLLSVGMLIDLSMVFGDLKTIEMAIFMTITVTACKGGAAWLMRVIFGYGKDDVVVAWGLSLPQAATTLAVVLVGHDLKLFDDAVLNATIVMVFVTCFLGPLLVQIGGRRIADKAAQETAEESDEASLQRMLLPLANPASSHNLLDLAVSMRRPLVDEPVLPMSVANKESAVASSEKLLADSVLHLAASDVPVRPVIRVDLNAVNGIMRAMQEMRATSLIVGWNGPRNYWQRHFHLSRGLIDELISETVNQLLVVRLTQPISVIKRVIVVLPNHAASEQGFIELLSDCKLMTKRIGATIQFCGESINNEKLRQDIINTKPELPIEFGEEKTGEEIPAHLGPMVKETDLVFIFGCREGTATWDSQWNRIPTRIAHHAGKSSIVIGYPRIRTEVSSNTRNTTRSFSRENELIKKALFVFNNQEADLFRLIDETLPKFGQIAAPALRTALVDSISTLSDCVALMHVHTKSIKRPQLAVIYMEDSLEFNGLSSRLVLILLNPLNQSAENHLANLSAIAQVVRNKELIDKSLTAHDEGNNDDARRLFRAK